MLRGGGILEARSGISAKDRLGLEQVRLFGLKAGGAGVIGSGFKGLLDCRSGVWLVLEI